MVGKGVFVSCLLLVLAFIDFSQGKLPDYIKACSRSDPKFDECAFQSARASLKKFAKGDKERNIPQLDPLRVKEIKAIGNKNQDGLNVIFTDCKLTGCADLDLIKFKIDFEKKKIIGKANGDLVMEALYDISGRILIIPLTGHGNAFIDLRECKFTYKLNFEYVKGADGKEYLTILNDSLKYDIGKASFRLENLFNGDKVLGQTTNRLLNDSWKEVISEVGPPVAETLKNAFRNTIQKFLDVTPVEELLLP